MGLTVATESKLGSDCTGSTGTANRTLTLANTQLTVASGLLVYVSGLALASTTDYTIVHNTSGTVITFLNKVWDDMTIVVNYYQQTTTSNLYSTMREDIQEIIMDHGIELTLMRQTETVDSMGGVTATTDAEYTIWTLIQDITKKDRQIHEMGLAVPGNSKAFFYHEYPNTITGNGVLRVETGDILKWVTPESSTQYWRVEQILGQKQGDNKEIFRTAIVRNVELSK